MPEDETKTINLGLVQIVAKRRTEPIKEFVEFSVAVDRLIAEIVKASRLKMLADWLSRKLAKFRNHLR